MKQHKYRVWTGSKMEYNVMVGYLGAFYVGGMNPKDTACMSEFNTIYSEQVPIMQCTGLLDRNGKEIYEGDILRLRCGSDDGVFNLSEVKGEVVWNGIGFGISIQDKKVIAIGGSMEGKEVTWREMHSWVGEHTCLGVWTSKLEVVGNTYEKL